MGLTKNLGWISKYLTLDSAGAATFSSIVTTGNGIIVNGPTGGASTYMQFKNSGTSIAVQGSDASIFGGVSTDFGTYVYGNNNYYVATNATKQLIISGTGAATFASSVTAGGTITSLNGSNGRFNIGSLTNYLYGDSSSNIILGNSGGDRLIINSSGNVGIGTASPLAKLVISNGGTQGIEFGYSSTLSANYLQSYNRSTNAGVDMAYYLTETASHIFYAGSLEKMRITSGGNVGIGTTTPTLYAGYTTLAINGGSGCALELKAGDTSGLKIFSDTAQSYLYESRNMPLKFYTNSALALTLEASGTATFASSLLTTYVRYGYIDRSPNNYIAKRIGAVGDYERFVILLHPVYNGTLITNSECRGVFTKRRGGTTSGVNRGSYRVETFTGYTSDTYSLCSTGGGSGELYTCTYNGIKYVCLVPNYDVSAQEYSFDGYLLGDVNSLKLIPYINSNNGTVLNTEINSSLVIIPNSSQTNFAFKGDIVGRKIDAPQEVTAYNNGTTFIANYNSLPNNSSKSFIIYNASDSPIPSSGLYTVSMIKWDGNYGSMTAINCEPSTQKLYVKTIYGGNWSGWVEK